MNRKQPLKGYGNSLAVVSATFVGAGAAPPTVATNAQHNKQTNAASSATRSGAGVYTFTLAADAAMPRVHHVIVTVEPTTKSANVTTAYNASTRTVGVTVLDAAGAAADLANGTDFLKLTLFGQDSTS